jgi:alkanesulfonate monooxygenase SsuD/methylene tetrahydromethanopterin reductase-like flavin-dependent oxidoreductase (luciferase family)
MPDAATNRAGAPVLECWSSLAALAALTSQIRLGTLVSANTYRHSAVVANAAATIDQISNGRFILGIGAGWQVNEHDAYGLDLFDVSTRSDRLEQACEVLNLLLRNERSDFAGTHYTLADAPCDPKPVQQPLPLLVAGKGERRTMRTAARLADEWNGWCTPDEFREKTAVLDAHCEAIGRDPSTIRRSTQALLFMSDDAAWLDRHRGPAGSRPQLIGSPAEVLSQVGDYADAGVDELVIPDWTMGSLTRAKDTCDQFITEVASSFRAD